MRANTMMKHFFIGVAAVIAAGYLMKKTRDDVQFIADASDGFDT